MGPLATASCAQNSNIFLQSDALHPISRSHGDAEWLCEQEREAKSPSHHLLCW